MAHSNFHIYTVKEITLYIKNRLTSDHNLQDIWLQGEISNFVHHSSGHFYFTLKDEHSQLPCAMFRWANEDLKFKLDDGLKVLVKGSIDLYAPQGRYNFVVTEVHPKGTGELYLRFAQLKERLVKEGLFDVKYKKPIPRFPNRIGIITSPTGAAIQDILNIMRRRFPCAGVVVVPTMVQGEKAAEDIVRAIRLVNTYEHLDVAIVGRGGGSIEDLWPFNEEIVARAIFESNVPIVSAVGHETDFSISDFVADLRAATPSAAAELIVPDKKDVSRQINGFMSALLQNMRNMLMVHQKHVEGISSAIKPKLLIDNIVQYQQRTDDLTSKMTMQIEHNLKIYEGRFNALCEMLDAVSPLSTLRRGYSITLKMPEETTVDSVEAASEGDDVKVVLQDGEMKCSVKKIELNGRIMKKKILQTKEDKKEK
ncbi:MAG: exodeoxyribonuclease VII large subunit [Methanomassiliicoccales archaeon]|nr:MAG: exodeoxyribonuclease VII large subunit [Methanomassiliicoccales archaeon]